jgi:hypothetical protein
MKFCYLYLKPMLSPVGLGDRKKIQIPSFLEAPIQNLLASSRRELAFGPTENLVPLLSRSGKTSAYAARFTGPVNESGLEHSAPPVNSFNDVTQTGLGWVKRKRNPEARLSTTGQRVQLRPDQPRRDCAAY